MYHRWKQYTHLLFYRYLFIPIAYSIRHSPMYNEYINSFVYENTE